MLFPIVLGVLTGAFILASTSTSTARGVRSWWDVLA